jgi:hypothetical protein
VLSSARSVVAFHSALAARAESLVPTCRTKLLIIPQAVQLPTVFLSAPFAFPIDVQVKFLLPLGIRAVKDPLFVLDAFERSFPNAALFLCGPVLDEALGQRVVGLFSAINDV